MLFAASDPLAAMKARYASTVSSTNSEASKTQTQLYEESHTTVAIKDAHVEIKGNFTFDILRYISKKSKRTMPAVICAARAHLSALASSCSSERTFSDAGKTLSPWRSTMGVKKFRRTVFLKGNRHMMKSVKDLKAKYMAKHHAKK